MNLFYIHLTSHAFVSYMYLFANIHLKDFHLHKRNDYRVEGHHFLYRPFDIQFPTLIQQSFYLQKITTSIRLDLCMYDRLQTYHCNINTSCLLGPGVLPQCIQRWISILLCRPAVPQQPAGAAALHRRRQQDVSGKHFYLSYIFCAQCSKNVR